MPAIYILGPFLILFGLNLPLSFKREKVAFGVAGAWLIFQIITAAFPVIGNSFVALNRLFNFDLVMDQLSLIMLFTIGLIAAIALFLGAGANYSNRQRFYFYNLLLIAVIGMNATVLVRDLFSLYLFVEITAVASFVLIALERTKAAIEGTFKYLALSVVASVFMLTAIALFVFLSANMSFSAVQAAFAGGENKFWPGLAAALFLCGVFIKSGAFPFHAWVPDAYSSASSPVSVLLAGIITKVSGVYVLLRLFGSVFILSGSLQNVIMLVGAITIVLAALAALTQDDLKRMLAYSSISQIGFIVLALGCATPLAFLGAVFHFFNHAVFKSLLFVNAAALETRLKTTSMEKMEGQGGVLPVTSVTSLIGLLSTAGIPPLSGFWSKLLIIVALWSAGKFGYAAVALLSSVITLAYFLNWERKVFFGKAAAVAAEPVKIPFGITFSEVFLTVIIIVVGLAFPLIFNDWLMPVQNVFILK